MEFLDTLDSIRSEDASVQRIFGGEGIRIQRGSRDSQYQRKLAETAKFLGQVLKGSRPVHHLQEAMTTSDFPLLFGDILDRQILAAYREWPANWANYAARRELRDFRPTKLFLPLTGADSRLEEVDELEEYPEAAVAEQPTQLLTVRKFGRRMSFSWETTINDDLNQITDFPQRLGRAARRTEDRMAAELFVGVNGPLASVYSNGNKNIVNIANGALANNPTLTIAGLQDAFRVLAMRVDESGEPILMETVELVVPPALEIVALNIMNSLQLEITAGSAGGVRDNGTLGEQRLIVANWMRNRLRLNVNPYIPLIATTANTHTSWWLFANPSVGRPALQMNFLRGYSEPQTFIKEPNARRVGGGGVDPMQGDFDNDAITYKVRHVVGSAVVDVRATVASNGSAA